MEETRAKRGTVPLTREISSTRNTNEYSDSDELGMSRVYTNQHTLETTPLGASGSNDINAEAQDRAGRSGDAVQYKLYKRRFFGLFQLTLLNIIISWDWLTFSASSVTAGQYLRVTQNSINWLSNCIFFAYFVAAFPAMWVLNRGGPRPAILIACVLTFLGNWIRYAGTRANPEKGGIFGLIVFGQILIGFAQPFVLSAPTRYSDMWFSDKGRVVATALPSLANPFGGAIGQLVGPYIATSPSQVPNLVLYIAIIATVASLPAVFVPRAPPTPPCASSVANKTTPLDMQTFRALFSNMSFYLIAVPFILFVSCFNAISSLINQILYPFSYTETQAGLAGAILILAGIVSALITSPILDRYKRISLPFLVIIVTLMAAMYIAFIFAPWTRTVAAPYAILAILGASSFSLLPFSLELMVDLCYPISPEISSSICWAIGNLCGGLLLLVMTALRDGPLLENGPGTYHPGNSPPGNMNKALAYEAVFAVIAVPAALYLRIKRHKDLKFRSDMVSSGDVSFSHAA